MNAGSYNSSKLCVHLWLLWPSSHFTSSISHSPSSLITAITYFKSLKLSSLWPQESMDSLHKRLERSRQMQTVLRAFEARDRNLLEDNLWRVSFWSCASVLVMLCVALTQVNWALTRHNMVIQWPNVWGVSAYVNLSHSLMPVYIPPAGLHCT